MAGIGKLTVYRIEGSDVLSKQSNQRYRKEKESEHLKKANVDSSSSGSGSKGNNQDKINHEFPADSIKR